MLIGELAVEDYLRLIHFAISCGAEILTVAPPTLEISEALSPFHIGQRRVQDSQHPRLYYATQSVWHLTPEAIDVFCRFHSDKSQRTSWTFLRSGVAFLNISSDSVSLNLVQSQWEQLFRLGFRFSLQKPDGSLFKPSFEAADLPENRRRVSFPSINKPKSPADVIAAPFAMQSYPPAYGWRRSNRNLLENPLINAWWSTSHDEILAAQIAKDGWRWWPSISGLAAVMDRDVLERWKRDDPECLRLGGWGELLTGYSRARADFLGLTSLMHWPEDAANCSICGDKFSPSIHHRGVKKASRLFDRLCYTCIQDAYNSRDARATREEILLYAKELAENLGRIPNATFGRSHEDYGLLTEENYTGVVRLLWKRPADERVKVECGSWFQTLIDCGVLEDGTRRLSRGTQCIASDGHVCLSLAEKTIDDLLTELGIEHQKESPYPDSRFRCDFLVGSIYVEYFGLHGNPEYDTRSQAKLDLCRRLGLRLVGIYPEDLLNSSKLRKTLQDLVVNTSDSNIYMV